MKPLRNLLRSSSALSYPRSLLSYLLDMSRSSLLPAKRCASGRAQRSGQYARLRGRTYEAPLCAAHFAHLDLLVTIFRGTLKKRLTGFTLLEVLIVVLIIALLAGLAFVQLMPDETRVINRETDRLAQALEHAAWAAQWRGELLAVSIAGNSYQFWRRDSHTYPVKQEWLPIQDDEVLQNYVLPNGISNHIQNRSNLIYFHPSGANEPYQIVVSGSDSQRVIYSDPLNRITISDALAYRDHP